MLICEICNKEFDRKMALVGHRAWHVKRNGLDILKNKERSEKIKQENISKYLENPQKCTQCNCVIDYDKFLTKSADKRINEKKGKSYNYFCSRNCSAKFNNVKRGKLSDKCKNKISNSLKEHFFKNKESRISNNSNKKYLKYTYQLLNCSQCNKTFETTQDKIRKTCSIECRNLQISVRRQEYLKENGNFSTPREIFEYKDIIIKVDSNLEKAGIVYLKDILNATRLERFNNILNYNDGIKNKTYNPDFICLVEDQTCIVEIKQMWTSKSKHIYNLNIPHKKKCLEDFCKKNNFRILWLDFESTPELKEIYKKILKERKNKL
jgi:hypothetical protein